MKILEFFFFLKNSKCKNTYYHARFLICRYFQLINVGLKLLKMLIFYAPPWEETARFRQITLFLP